MTIIPCQHCNSGNLLILTHGLSGGNGYIKCRDCGRAVVLPRLVIEGAVKVWNKKAKGAGVLGCKVTPRQTSDACMSYRHDFGMMRGSVRYMLMREAERWLHAWQKALGFY